MKSLNRSQDQNLLVKTILIDVFFDYLIFEHIKLSPKSINYTKETWLVEIAKDRKKLKLKIFDHDTMPEFEVLDYQYE